MQTWKGWSVNLTDSGFDHTFEIELPSPPMFVAQAGPVIEVVFWSVLAARWVHQVSAHFVRQLSPGHVQVTVGDLAWLHQLFNTRGYSGVALGIAELEREMIPGLD